MEPAEGKPPVLALGGIGAVFCALGATIMVLFGSEGQWEPVGAGACFLLFGLFPIGILLREAALMWKAEQRQRLYPQEPWLWDEWDKRFASQIDAWETYLFFAISIVIVGMTPWVLAKARWSRGEDIFCAILMLILGAAYAVCFWATGSELMARLRHGSPKLHFGTFPALLGEPFVAYLEIPYLPVESKPLSMTLLCFRDKWVKTGNTYHETREILLSQTTWAGRDPESVNPMWKVTLTPARGAPMSRLWAFPKIRWELQVDIPSPYSGRIPFHLRFPVPVYGAPASQ